MYDMICLIKVMLPCDCNDKFLSLLRGLKKNLVESV